MFDELNTNIEGYMREAWLEKALAIAKALLEQLAETEPAGYDAESSNRRCAYCEADAYEGEPIEHKPDCPWLKIHAFLEQAA